MTLDTTPIQPARDAGPVLPLPDDATARAARDGSPSPLTHCIAWLFGLEAFLRDPTEPERPRLRN